MPQFNNLSLADTYGRGVADRNRNALAQQDMAIGREQLRQMRAPPIPKLTEAERNYIRAKQEGYQGSFQEFMRGPLGKGDLVAVAGESGATEYVAAPDAIGRQPVSNVSNAKPPALMVELSRQNELRAQEGLPPLSPLEYRQQSAGATAEGKASVTSAADRTAAANKYPQVQAARRQIDRVRKASEALKDNMFMRGAPGMGLIKTPEVQELEQSGGTLINSLQALTRIPGVGAQSDWEGRLNMLRIPSANMYGEVRDNAVKELEALFNDLETAVSNVAQGKTGVSQNQPIPTGRTATNPNTGERLQEMSDGNWAPL